jgi:hypothetical protein
VFGGQHYEKIVIALERLRFGEKFEVNVEALHEKACSSTWILAINSAFALGRRETHGKNLDRVV